LLLADGLKALQTATIASALPFSIVLLASIWGLLRALKLDATKRSVRFQALPHTPNRLRPRGGWQRRLQTLVSFPGLSEARRFVEDTAHDAVEAVAEELRKRGLDARSERSGEDRVRLVVAHGAETDFLYEVRPRPFHRPNFVLLDDEASGEEHYYRAEVHLLEGGQDYDLMGWSRDDVIGDILDQYEKHMHFLHLVR